MVIDVRTRAVLISPELTTYWNDIWFIKEKSVEYKRIRSEVERKTMAALILRTEHVPSKDYVFMLVSLLNLITKALWRHCTEDG